MLAHVVDFKKRCSTPRTTWRTVPRQCARRARTSGTDDVTTTLAKLADLRDKGAITPAEYEKKKPNCSPYLDIGRAGVQRVATSALPTRGNEDPVEFASYRRSGHLGRPVLPRKRAGPRVRACLHAWKLGDGTAKLFGASASIRCVTSIRRRAADLSVVLV